MDRVRVRVKDKRVLALVKAFLKAGILTELGENKDTHTGTPQGASCPRCWPIWRCRCSMSTCSVDGGRPGTWPPPASAPDAGAGICRTGGSSATRMTSSCSCTAPAPTACATTSPTCFQPLGLRLSPAKTQVVHMSDGFDFLGFHLQWRRKVGTNKWYVYTFIGDPPIRSLKAKIRA